MNSKRTILWFVGLALVIIFIATVVTALKQETNRATTETGDNIFSAPPTSENLIWEMKKDGRWEVVGGKAPACPEPLVLQTPVDISKIASILYPGQVRGPEYKNHGAFRFKDGHVSDSVVRVPVDSLVVRGEHFFANGEDQYAFEFQMPCGVVYHFGHLRVLSPKFKEIIDNLPPTDEGSNFASLRPPLEVTAGEVVATGVGYAHDGNIFVDWGVRDLRQKNDATIRPEWSRYAERFDRYSVCFLEYISSTDAQRLRDLKSTGDFEWGNKSDFCHYPDNQ